MQYLKIKPIICLIACLFAFSLQAQEQHRSVKKVLKILQGQTDHWNKGDLEGFMQDYWKSDQLQFIGSKGVVYGWQQTLDNYKKSYPDRAAMGQLTFDILNTQRLSRKVISVTGKFTLKRENDMPTGHFLIIWKKIKGKWVIIADHSS